VPGAACTATGVPSDSVVNAASQAGGGVAPGEIVTVIGRWMGPSEVTPLSKGEDGRLATTLAGSRILFNSVAAPLLYVSATESRPVLASVLTAAVLA